MLGCKEQENTKPELKDIAELSNTVIGVSEKDGDVVTVTDQSILKAGQQLLKDTGLDIETKSYQMIEIDNKKYLRIFSTYNYVTTLELMVDTDNNLVTGNTACTSKVKASGEGCLPNGDYCTASKDGGDAEECVRTTTA